MSTSKPTKGSFIVRETGEWPYTNHWLGIYSDTGTGQVAKVEGWGETSRDRANLIADALNVQDETGLTPRELLAQRDELVRSIDAAISNLAGVGFPVDSAGRYCKGGEWNFSDAIPRDVDAHEVKAAFTLLRAAIAATKEPK